MVNQARANMAAAGLGGRFDLRTGAAGRLPFPDGSFDVVTSTASLHHWKEPAAALDDIHRVLKPGGQALLYDIVRGIPPEVLREMEREFGRLKVGLFWLHSFEEPSFRPEGIEALARSTCFGGRTGFVGLLCRLALKKIPLDPGGARKVCSS